jgi:hypothetical protein
MMVQQQISHSPPSGHGQQRHPVLIPRGLRTLMMEEVVEVVLVESALEGML